MISGATRGKGGSGLWRHLLDYKHQNDAVMVGASRGLIETGTKDQIKELTHIGRYASHSKPLHHVHADPADGVVAVLPARHRNVPEWSLKETTA